MVAPHKIDSQMQSEGTCQFISEAGYKIINPFSGSEFLKDKEYHLFLPEIRNFINSNRNL